MNCRQVQKRLADYSAGFIQGELRQRLEKHIVACDACRAHLQELRSLDRLLAADRVEAHEAFARRVMARVRAVGIPRGSYWLYLLEGVGPILAVAAALPIAILVLWRVVEPWIKSMPVRPADWSLLAEPNVGTGVVLGLAFVMAAVLWLSHRLAEALT